MGKEPRRKPKKIQHPKVKPCRIDEELADLAEVLDEYRLDNNAQGWFQIPWRDGWAAVELPWQAWRCLKIVDQNQQTADFIQKIIDLKKPDAETYWQVNEHIERVDSKLLYASLRCIQVVISNSSGGGNVYNDILRRGFELLRPASWIEDLVLEYRCRDAIGVTSNMCGDVFDRQRRAFAIAWRRGLYHAAYSIPPVFNAGKLTIHKAPN